MIRLWLYETLRGLVRVQSCVVKPSLGLTPRAVPVDLRVMLWTGVVIHIYIVTEPMRTRSLRGLLQLETNQGIGVLFIVAPALLPQHDEILSPPEWLLALHALGNERIYSYPDTAQTELLQLHFDRLDATERCRTIYGPPVDVEDLNFGQVNVKQRYVKGFWLTAHFGLNGFWQGQTRSYQPPPRRQYQRSVPGDPQPKPPPKNGAAPPPNSAPPPPPRSAPPRKPATRLEASFDLLGVPMNASEEEVKIAFRRRVFSVHPDVSALPKSMAEEKFRALAEAYEYIKSRRGWN